MTRLFTVFGPRQNVFKNDSKMIDLGQKGNYVFIIILVFLTVFCHCEKPPVLHNFELIRILKVFQNSLRRLIFGRIRFLVV